MSDIVINGTTYNSVESITVKDTSGSDVLYTKGQSESVLYNENLLFNQEFKVNQKGSTKYVATGSTIPTFYTCDRWIRDRYIEAGYDSSNNFYIKNTKTDNPYYFGQFIYNHTKLLGNKATFWLSTSTQDYTFTFNTLPEDTSTITQNTVLESFDTDFGGVQLEWRKTHFIINIKLNPSKTLTLKGAKLEVGDKFTGFVKKDEYDELVECMRFLQAPIDKNQWRIGSMYTTSTEKTFTLLFDFYPMIKNPNVLTYSNSSNNTTLRYRSGTTTSEWLAVRSYGVGSWQGGRTKFFNFGINGTFSDELGENTSSRQIVEVGMQNLSFEAEITD